MPRIPSLAFLVAGVILLIYGIGAADSMSSSVTEAVTGAPSDKSIWLIVLGVIGILVGGVSLFFRRSS